MFNLLRRLLSAYSGKRTDWLQSHPSARLVSSLQQQARGMFVYEDNRTHESAVYITDDIGNVTNVDIVSQ